MGKKSTKRYSPKFKFTVVLEVLKSEKSDAEVARAFDILPATLSRWKQAFLEKGPEVFGGSEEVKGYENRIGQLERMLGQKEVEIALLKNFFPRAELGRAHRVGGGASGRAGAEPMPGGAGRLEGDLALPDARGLKAGRAEGSGRSPPDSSGGGDPGASILRVPPDPSGP